MSKCLNVFATIAMVVVSMVAGAQEGKALPWGTNFEEAKFLKAHAICDGGASEVKFYEDSVNAFKGITVKFKGGMLYVFTGSAGKVAYLKKDGGQLNKITENEIISTLKTVAPSAMTRMQVASAKGCRNL